jgi:hypothetical protein
VQFTRYRADNSPIGSFRSSVGDAGQWRRVRALRISCMTA